MSSPSITVSDFIQPTDDAQPWLSAQPELPPPDPALRGDATNCWDGDRCSISLKPVIDLPAGHLPVDSYEIPTRLREQLQLRYPADMFPYAATVSRRLDMDHTIAYLSPASGGPPGQTRIGNLGPHVRRHHNYKTNGGWQVRQPVPGIWLWRSPHRRIYLVNAAGTHPLGDSGYAQKMWRAARPHNNSWTNSHFQAPIETFIPRCGGIC